MAPCALCEPENARRAILRRPKTGQAVCRECFYLVFETEVHNTIQRNALFRRGERVGVAASGGKGEQLDPLRCILCQLSILYCPARTESYLPITSKCNQIQLYLHIS